MGAEKGKATAGETMAKPLQKCKSITGKCYRMHSTLSRKKNYLLVVFLRPSVTGFAVPVKDALNFSKKRVALQGIRPFARNCENRWGDKVETAGC